jgi:hypothetical protein
MVSQLFWKVNKFFKKIYGSIARVGLGLIFEDPVILRHTKLGKAFLED